MKIFKILSIGVITFLGIPEGKTAEPPNTVPDTVAEKMRRVIKSGKEAEQALKAFGDAMQKSGLSVDLPSFYEFQDNPRETGVKNGFPASDVYKMFNEMYITAQSSWSLGKNIQQWEEILNRFAIHEAPQIPSSPIEGSASRFIEELVNSSVVSLEKKEPEIEIAKRELNAGNLSRFLVEISHFRNRTIEFMTSMEEFNYEEERIENTIDVKEKFDFSLVRPKLARIEEYLEEAIKTVRPETARLDSTFIFFESMDPNSTASQVYKKGLFGFMKIVKEKQMETLASLVPSQSSEFLRSADEIKTYIEYHKA